MNTVRKLKQRAKEAGVTPLQFVDDIVVGIKDLWSNLDISYDDFIRTTQERHKTVVQKIFARLLEQDDIYLSEYEGLYCTPCEAFWTERQVKEANDNCPDCKRPVELVQREVLFLPHEEICGSFDSVL